MVCEPCCHLETSICCCSTGESEGKPQSMFLFSGLEIFKLIFKLSSWIDIIVLFFVFHCMNITSVILLCCVIEWFWNGTYFFNHLSGTFLIMRTAVSWMWFSCCLTDGHCQTDCYKCVPLSLIWHLAVDNVGPTKLHKTFHSLILCPKDQDSVLDWNNDSKSCSKDKVQFTSSYLCVDS